MSIILDGKLNAEDRRNLNDSDFGLPKQRKYPINDESHVRSAIRFFKFANKSERKELAKNINRKLKEFKIKVKVGEDNPFYNYADKSYIITENTIGDIEPMEDINKTIEYLETRKSQLENEIYIITKDILKSRPENYIYPHMTSERNQKIIDLIGSYTIDCERVGLFKEYQLELTELDIMKLCSAKRHINTVVKGELLDGKSVWYSIIEEKLFLIYTNREKPVRVQNTTNIYYLLELTKDVIRHLITYSGISDCKRIKLKFINNNLELNNTVSEAFQINSDGDVKISINPLKSYMDEYSEVHRLLIENFKNKNYEGMKNNLAYIFALINTIERDKRYKNRERDVVKARAFLINDFKTYLKHVQKHDPKFDFVEYYKTKDYDKYIINIPKATIIGIKKLLKAILSD